MRPDAYWDAIVGQAHARVLSKIETPRCAAYLLSESSLFVFDRELVMSTCGQSDLAAAAAAVARDLALVDIEFFLYQRKSEKFPGQQPTRFKDDVARLLQRVDGADFTVQSVGGTRLSFFHYARHASSVARPALEIILHDLPERVRGLFHDRARGGDAFAAAFNEARSALRGLLPGFAIDDHLFSPHGYSVNAVRDDRYFSIHVTPEREGSCASFESNLELTPETFARLTGELTRIFEPATLDVITLGGDAPTGAPKHYARAGAVIASPMSAFNGPRAPGVQCVSFARDARQGATHGRAEPSPPQDHVLL